MIKSIASFIGATALVMAPVAASAQTMLPDHIYSTANPLVLEGDASLGNLQCYLILTATLDDDHGLGHENIDN